MLQSCSRSQPTWASWYGESQHGTPWSTTYARAWDEKWSICRKSLLSAWKHCFSAQSLGLPLIHDYLVFLLYFSSTVMYNVLSIVGIAALGLAQVTNAIETTRTLARLRISARCANRGELRFTCLPLVLLLILFIIAHKKTYLRYSMVLAVCDPDTCDSYVVIDSSLQYSLYSLFYICFITQNINYYACVNRRTYTDMPLSKTSAIACNLTLIGVVVYTFLPAVLTGLAVPRESCPSRHCSHPALLVVAYNRWWSFLPGILSTASRAFQTRCPGERDFS